MSGLPDCLGLGVVPDINQRMAHPQPSVTVLEAALPGHLVMKDKQGSREIVREILRTHEALLALPSLGPGKPINELLNNLVWLCTQIHDSNTVREV